MKKSKKRTITLIIAVLAGVAVCAAVFAALFYFGVLHINNPDPGKYPVTGVDVSHYQGDIDWAILSGQGVDFAFIKATEGSSYVDSCFLKNWSDAAKTDLRIGAYHFFSFESSGERQAELFCSTVNIVDNMLPPVIDVEYYGRFKSKEMVNLEDIKKELLSLVDILTANYGVKPIIYCDAKTYADIIKDTFNDCPLWYRSVYSSPPSEINWTFWQYSNRHVLNGYNGQERYIDMNVFSGTEEEFSNF